MTNIWRCCHLRIKCLPANLLAALMWRWYLNSEGTTFQLRMEDSREGKEDDEKGRWMPNPHVDDKKGKKPWYIKKGKTEERGVKKKREEKKRKITSLGHVRRDLLLCSMFVSWLFLHQNPIFWPKITLAFFPVLYKFIVWAPWTWIHSRFGFKPNLVLTIGAVCGKTAWSDQKEIWV